MPSSASAAPELAPAPARSLPRALRPAALLALFYACLVVLHAPLLRLPYFWDEAGYYVPAARDLLLTGSLIPQTTISNAHPPLLIAYLAGAWKIFGYSPLVTRLAMLLVAAFALLATWRLACRAAGRETAAAVVLCTALYPVFFAQSSLAHLDLAAAALILWGLADYLRAAHPKLKLKTETPKSDHPFTRSPGGGPPLSRPLLAGQGGVWLRRRAILFFALACLAKETAVIVPVTLFAWEILPDNWKARLGTFRSPDHPITRSPDSFISRSPDLLIAALPLAAWYAAHYLRTGYVFGNPQFFHYNLAATLHPARIVAAFVLRLWHLFGYLNMFVLTAAVILALRLLPRQDRAAARRRVRGNGHPKLTVPGIAPEVQAVFVVLIVAHMLALSVLGGAVLARYMLPVYPLVMILFIATLRRRLPWWRAFVAVVVLSFLLALVTNPPYRFAPEDNLAYADFVRLHQSADRVIAERYPRARVLTAWPASDELTRPWLGYVAQPVQILRIEDFSTQEILSAAEVRGRFDVALLFSTKYEPRLLLQLPFWERLQARYFGFHRDLPPALAARLLGGRIVFEQHRAGQWVAVLVLERSELARN